MILRTMLALAGTPFLVSPVPASSSDDGSPGPRYGHEIVFDEARGITLLFGGFGPDGEPRSDTWGWDGAAWRRLAEGGPSPRKWAAAAYDAQSARVVLFGGREGEGRSGRSLGDTWIWNGSEWRNVGVSGPPARDHHQLVYDRARSRLVLFGGWDGERVVGDVWEWSGRPEDPWVLASSDGPAPRAPFGMVFDERRELVILTGGQNLDRTFSDAWTWDGATWTPLSAGAPSPLSFHAMTYDGARGRILLMGGRHGDRLFRDLWSWDGAAGTRLDASGPFRRGFHASAYDARRKALVLHGSGERLRGGWHLDDTTWTWSDVAGWTAHGGSGERKLPPHPSEGASVVTLDRIAHCGTAWTLTLRASGAARREVDERCSDEPSYVQRFHLSADDVAAVRAAIERADLMDLRQAIRAETLYPDEIAFAITVPQGEGTRRIVARGLERADSRAADRFRMVWNAVVARIPDPDEDE